MFDSKLRNSIQKYEFALIEILASCFHTNASHLQIINKKLKLDIQENVPLPWLGLFGETPDPITQLFGLLKLGVR